MFKIYAHGQLKGRLGWSAWSLTTGSWSEAYAGPTYAPAKWVELSASAGIERDDKPLRLATSVWLGNDKFSLLSIHETGGSGYWFKNLGKWQVSKTVAVGVFSQRFAGIGPYAEKKIRKVTVWATYLNDEGRSNGFIGVKLNFGD